VLSGIIFFNRNGLRRRDAPREYGSGAEDGREPNVGDLDRFCVQWKPQQPDHADLANLFN
jgi:hypothetical protein